MKKRSNAYATPRFSLHDACWFAAGFIRDSEVEGQITQILPETTWSNPGVPEYSVRGGGAVFLARETELKPLEKKAQ